MVNDPLAQFTLLAGNDVAADAIALSRVVGERAGDGDAGVPRGDPATHRRMLLVIARVSAGFRQHDPAEGRIGLSGPALELGAGEVRQAIKRFESFRSGIEFTIAVFPHAMDLGRVEVLLGFVEIMGQADFLGARVSLEKALIKKLKTTRFGGQRFEFGELQEVLHLLNDEWA